MASAPTEQGLAVSEKPACSCIMANVLQTNKVDAQCDKVAFDASVGGYPVWALPRFLASENWSPWGIVWRCLRYPTFSRFSRTPSCDRRTDRNTTTA